MFESNFIEEALDDPAMVFAILKKLENDGFEYSTPIVDLSSEDRREVLARIYAELQRQEMH